jgi:predicted nucleic acid-binding Zn ribbon protein
MTITCEHCGKTHDARIKGQRFCSDRCRVSNWMAQHPRKGRKPKRVRSRERDRLYTIIHKRQTLEQLRALAMKAFGLPEDWGKLDIPADLPEFNCDPESSAFSEETLEQLREQALLVTALEDVRAGRVKPLVDIEADLEKEFASKRVQAMRDSE